MKQVYFIAEIGKGCNGDLGYCERILKECKEAGAHGVRFHHFYLEDNIYPEVLNKATERAWSFKFQLPFLSEALFSKEDYKTILKWCEQLKLDFIATPWDFKSLELFQSLGVGHYKVNSINLMNIPLVQAILKASQKVYLSTGGMAEHEIEQLCQKLKLSQFDSVLMHAVLAYPAPANIINIRAVQILQKYHSQVGYSSNDVTMTSTLMACSLGATVIEKHVHLESDSKEFHRASITVSRFAEEVNNVREIQEMMTRNIKQEARGEMINQEILTKSLVLKEDLAEGAILTEQNLTLQLPPKGVHAKKWFEVIGQRTSCALKKGSYLYSTQIKGFNKNQALSEGEIYRPGKKGVVVRFKDIDEMIEGRQVDYVEVHYAASDLKKQDVCKEYDLDLVVHLPEYADGVFLDLSSHDRHIREFSIDVINDVMERARRLKPLFKKCEGPVKFITHPGAATYPGLDPHPEELNDLFLDSLKRLDSSGLEILIENMAPYAWFLDDDWSPKQAISNSFLDSEDIARFLKEHNYSMCLDVCHAKLYCNNTSKDFYSLMKTLKPYVKHIHFSDCTGIDGEGLQIGDGDHNWQDICEVFEDFQYGWTPEIWNGHLDHGHKFYEAHHRLNQQFKKYFENKKPAQSMALV